MTLPPLPCASWRRKPEWQTPIWYRADQGIFFSLEVLTVDGHEKRGAYVSSHLHLNVTYLAIADPKEPLRIKPDENNAVAWVPLTEAIGRSSEPWIRDRIYRKIIDKLAAF